MGTGPIITGVIIPICTGVAVSLIVFFVTKFYSSAQSKKAAEISEKEQERLATEKRNLATLEALTMLSKATAQKSIVELGERYIQQGCVTTEELAIIDAIYKPYHAEPLVGNGIAENMINSVHQLPVVVEHG